MIQQQNEKLPQQSQNFLLGKKKENKIMVARLEMETFCILYQIRG